MPLSDVKNVLIALSTREAILVKGMLNGKFGVPDVALDVHDMMQLLEKRSYDLVFTDIEVVGEAIEDVAKRVLPGVLWVGVTQPGPESLLLNRMGCTLCIALPMELGTFAERIALAIDRQNTCSTATAALEETLRQVAHKTKSMMLDADTLCSLLDMMNKSPVCASLVNYTTIGLEKALSVRRSVRQLQIVAGLLAALAAFSLVGNYLQFSTRSTGYTDLQTIGSTPNASAVR